MTIQEIMKRIKLPEEAQRVVQEQKMTEEDYERWKVLFQIDLKMFLEEWKNQNQYKEKALYFYLRLSCETYTCYQEQKISDKVFDDTFYDITIWCEECYREYGVYGLKELWWLAQSINMKLFRLGRLQFEPIVIEEDMVGEKEVILKGTRALNVHVPAGESLDLKACLDSFRNAEAFFGEKGQIYVCDSWLLAPELKKLLSEKSNIVRFQNLFEITKVYYAFPQAEQRVFGEILEDKSQYPEDTLLQRNLKKYLMDGKNPGIGTGFVKNIYQYI